MADLPKYDVYSHAFWKKRLADAVGRGLCHYAVFETGYDSWYSIQEAHRGILKEHVKPTDNILDCGCGWGRLLDLLPENWCGKYVGVDISPDFISLAQSQSKRENFLARIKFMQGDLRNPYNWGAHHLKIGQQFDLAVFISVRPMVIRNMGEDDWKLMERNIRRIARKLLYLEYDDKDPGSLE